MSELAQVRPAAKSPNLVHASRRGLPPYLRHTFWNVDDTTYRTMDTRTNGTFIADRALTTRDPNLLAFAAYHLNAEAWRAAGRARGRAAPDRQLAENLADGGDASLRHHV